MLGWLFGKKTDKAGVREAILLDLPQDPPSAFKEYAREAIQSLGYLRPEAEDWLCELLSRTQFDVANAVSLDVRKAGEQISDQEKKALGLRSNTFFSRELLDLLTEKGRSKPLEALDNTYLRASFRQNSDKEVRRAIKDAGIKRFQVLAAFKECPGCRRLEGKEFSARDLPTLPPFDCWRDWCACVLQPQVKF